MVLWLVKHQVFRQREFLRPWVLPFLHALSFRPQSAAIRKIIPWELIQVHLEGMELTDAAKFLPKPLQNAKTLQNCKQSHCFHALT